MQNPITRFRRLPYDIQLYAWAWFLFGIGYAGIFSVLFNLYLSRIGIGTETIGFLTSAGLLAWGVGAIPAGMIGERMGNRRAVIVGNSIIVAALVLLMCVGFVPAASQVAWLTVWWVVAWLGNSLYFVNAAPWIMEVASPEERGDSFTAQEILINVGGSIGSLLAGFLPGAVAMVLAIEADSATAYWLALWIVPIVYIAGFCLIALTKPTAATKVAPQAVSSERLPYPILLFVVLLSFLYVSAEGLVRPFFNLYLDGQLAMPLSQIGLVFGIAQVIPIASTLAAPWLIRRFGAGRGLMAVGIAYSLCLLLLALVGTQLVAAIGYIAFMSIVPIAAVVSLVFTQEIVEARWRTAMNTAYTIGMALGQASYAGIGGIVITRWGYSALFLMGAVLALLFAVLIWGYLRVAPQKQPDVVGETSPAA